jgi:capsid protein
VIKSKYNTSYTAHKGALNDFTRSFLSKRELFISSICYPVLKEVAINLIMRGEIDAPGFFTGGERLQRAWLAGTWRGPQLGAINPAQEIKAKTDAVAQGLLLRSDAALDVSGAVDYEAMMRKRGGEEKLFGETGLKEPVAAPDKKNERTDGDEPPETDGHEPPENEREKPQNRREDKE